MMEVVLGFVAVFHLLYYALLLLLTDYSWSAELYWPISALLFALFAWLLHRDTLRWNRTGEAWPLKLRVFITVTLGGFLLCCISFAAADLIMGLAVVPENQDYLILVETTGQIDTLTNSDYAMLDKAYDYVTRPENSDCKLVLAGYNLEDSNAAYTEEIQYLMQTYLMDKGIPRNRMIIHQASNSLRKNIRYNYAYVLVDWYETGDHEDDTPLVAIMTNQLSVLRYRMMIYNLGLNVHVMTYSEALICWPARIKEEVRDTIYYHLVNQFKYQ